MFRDISTMEKGITYYWKSNKDGMIYAVKLVNKNEELKQNHFKIIGWSHPGYISKYRKENDQTIITKPFDQSPTCTQLHIFLIEEIISLIKRKFILDFKTQLKMLQELTELLEEHPDKYLKYMDILARDKMFNSLLEGKYNLKAVPQDNPL